jgi:hypothetical protein
VRDKNKKEKKKEKKSGKNVYRVCVIDGPGCENIQSNQELQECFPSMISLIRCRDALRR